jgi:hypothetical protein
MAAVVLWQPAIDVSVSWGYTTAPLRAVTRAVTSAGRIVKSDHLSFTFLNFLLYSATKLFKNDKI